MHNRMLARRPKGLRPKQRVTTVTRCPETGALGVAMSRVVKLDKPDPHHGQSGKSYEIAAPVA